MRRSSSSVTMLTVWVESRLHAYVGLYLIVKFDGRWLVDGDPNCVTFARYLVEVRHPEDGGPVRFDVGARVHDFLYGPPLRSLASMIIEMEKFIVNGGDEGKSVSPTPTYPNPSVPELSSCPRLTAFDLAARRNA